MSDNTTETLDKLYLEYSNLTTAVTAKEIALKKHIAELEAEIERLKDYKRLCFDLHMENPYCLEESEQIADRLADLVMRDIKKVSEDE